ncbi:MAG: aspartyl-tRNA(Asn)/glutamyl-tRNA(Gln) amidotransferase subunit [Aliidongia sp.]|nr:aspartyl-tRNA(Asn)/glutamyl-tRNA(Gln) amidotransferase subunit [Aliidongia sp.]
MPIEMVPLATLATDLAAGRCDSVTLTEACLERIEDQASEGKRAFTKLYRRAALAAAEAADRQRAAGVAGGPLAGIPISIKDLFDVAGETTLAGSSVLADQPPALRDAPIVSRLRAAGAVIVGKTNMVEFAYSGLGLNPHFGTPANPFDRARVPGGSSSGAGVAVPYGFSAASIGTDTGGSVRIPAAFNNVVGFKPTQRRVPRDGAVPLSTSLDSIGPLAPSVACCALIDAIMAGEEPAALAALPLRGLRLAVPRAGPTADLDETVARAFGRALTRLSQAGALVTEVGFPEFALLDQVMRHGGIAQPEAYAFHAPLIEKRRSFYDPRVLSRLLKAQHIMAADYIAALEARAAAIAGFDRASAPFDAVICPTVAVVPPRFDELTQDEDYSRMNQRVLRNAALFNLLDRCAVSLPCTEAGGLPVGLMLVGSNGGDHRLLEIGAAVERALAA